MQFGLAFSYQFSDTHWIKKFITICLVSMVPILGWMVAIGIIIETTRRFIYNDPELVPQIDFGKYLNRGFKAFVIILAYSLPAIIFLLPPPLLTVLLTQINRSLDLNQYSAVATLTLTITCIFTVLQWLYMALVGLLMPAVLGKYAAEDKMASAFHIKEIFHLFFAAPGAYLLTWLGGLVAGMTSSMGVVGSGIGLFLTLPYALTTLGSLYGQSYRNATNMGNSRKEALTRQI